MKMWLYAASKALASECDTLSLACDSGFIWRSFYSVIGIPIACVRDIQPGDDLVLGYRCGGAVRLLARFRVGRPDKPIDASRAFGEIPAVWVDEFRRHGYTDDPKLAALVGIFVEEGEPLTGELPYANQNSLSRLRPDALPRATSPFVRTLPATAAARGLPLPPADSTGRPTTSTPGDAVHVGIDVGGRREKGFDLCITEWVGGLLKAVQWKRLPHAMPLPRTFSLRALVREGDIAGVAAATQSSASATAVQRASTSTRPQPFLATGLAMAGSARSGALQESPFSPHPQSPAGMTTEATGAGSSMA